ncbi:bifunctional diaminohydroxyphosphoribosylaminopyrimidine deaminase/5-amino-6-(5-phosphoribosylamino)uracil reductase RibD [Shewanella sp. Scap07]|uniref:bifunctional diaminohydroxyphosphoribosylaminopyrimidine deaminase/5-amino-6-(5-phosphoribosylamino)uracil reductase RibD n=1 Tax=Shewanella sp. Scap07 TaxID=2589987 RepID=UPI0015BA352B|nr:bifunctional diaminohydroxyphosphoribosylaminopyrimidine deaminase/5-amino-6-(5-phosphoribosylamino)uracil reductase RibD [Shewanella sp. Scap07]QLE87739.1 bifunctional diaminohydroxyphosphoribosylaminopyrimidine deaminase/5-amino-6-(5-phosphoribosylamino)uracil reductase RibD [Shewanella sp. Scap07]
MMARAIKLAHKGRYTTAPNPSVGCVITQGETVVGEGFHIQAGGPHAEVHAIRAAGDATHGATAYVTLEPCSHYGRTPPCAKGLIDAKVARVVVAVTDPNPQVSGRGITMLQQAGIQVDVGLMSQAAAAINPGFMQRMATGLPRVTIKLAASIDGKTALQNGQSKWITGPKARQDVQRMRARHSALITGIETVLADDPSLNVRPQELGYVSEQVDSALIRQPVRVILDSGARARHSLKLFSITSPILLVSCSDYPQQETDNWPAHVSHLKLAAVDGRVPLDALLGYLAQSHNDVLVEAGATLAGAFVDQGLADELVLYQAPKIIGASGRDMLNLKVFSSMAQIPDIQLVDQVKVGVDTRFTFQIAKQR